MFEASGEGQAHAHAPKGNLAKLALGALGVVYGDIGTSPLYSVKECFSAPHGVAPTPDNVLGILSLVFWSLVFVIVVKYLTFIMRADNGGEGGILALLALVSGPGGKQAPLDRRTKTILVFLGLFGAALLYGDGMITPAISVLSAVEGLSVATHAVDHFVVPITCAILVALFLTQRFGTAKVGAVFGPITLLWFLAIAGIGLPWIVRVPRVFYAINPWYAAKFFYAHGLHGFLVLASVVLCITGGEALYADMGHFGRRPIRWAWYCIAFPALLLNYFGQGALLLSRGESVKHPFFELVSGWLLYPIVGLATLATVVASQALISGAFSLTQQAVQLGYCPRVSIVHTSSDAEGQIYVPEVNNLLMVACVALVITFGESTNLAAAYGIAVTGTMSITSVLFYFVGRRQWGWSKWQAGGLVALFLVFDLGFFGANLGKVLHGGWFPIVVAVVVFTIMTTWRRGREAVASYLLFATLPWDKFKEELARKKPGRVSGTGVFLASVSEGVPPVLHFHLAHNKVLQEQVVLLTIMTAHVPTIDGCDRVTIEDLGDGFFRVVATYGFSQQVNVPEILARCAAKELRIDHDDTTYYLGRESLVLKRKRSAGMMYWRKVLFAFLARNARTAFFAFGIPPRRVVEVGNQIEL